MEMSSRHSIVFFFAGACVGPWFLFKQFSRCLISYLFVARREDGACPTERVHAKRMDRYEIWSQSATKCMTATTYSFRNQMPCKRTEKQNGFHICPLATRRCLEGVLSSFPSFFTWKMKLFFFSLSFAGFLFDTRYSLTFFGEGVNNF